MQRKHKNPSACKPPGVNYFKSGTEGLEPPKWLDQNQLPYHLATSQCTTIMILYGR